MCTELKQLETFCRETLRKIEKQQSLESTLGEIDRVYVKVKETAVINDISDELSKITTYA